MLWAAVPAALFGAAIAFVLLPIVIVLQVARNGEDTPLRVRLDLAGWLGVLGVTARHRSDGEGWQVGGKLVGRHLGPWFALGRGTTRDPEEVDRSDEAGSEIIESEINESEIVVAPPNASERPELGAAAKPLWERIQHARTSMRPLLGPAWRLVLSCPSAFVVRQLRARGTIGLPDPASTGQIQGVVHALSAVLPGKVALEIESDFVEPGARGELSLHVHVSLGKMLYFVIRFAWVAGSRWLLARFSGWRLNRARAHGGAA